MLGLDEVVEGVFGGSPWGLGLVAVAAGLAVGGARAEPVGKGGIKGYLASSAQAREWVAEASEQIQDLYAEAKHEYESELSAADAGHAEPAAAAGATESRARRRNTSASSGLVVPSGEPA